MFTMSDLKRVLLELKGLKNPKIFYKSKNQQAYELSQLNSQYRGHAIEKLLRDKLIKKYKTHYHGGSHSHDMTINKGVRIEVKSALASPVVGSKSKKIIKYKFSFKHVQLSKFDILFLAYVTPNGLKIRWMSKATAREFVSNHRHKATQITINTHHLNKLEGSVWNKLKMPVSMKKKKQKIKN